MKWLLGTKQSEDSERGKYECHGPEKKPNKVPLTERKDADKDLPERSSWAMRED